MSPTGAGDDGHGRDSGPAGHRSLLDQVCLDLSSAVYDEKSQFWCALAGWERHRGTLPEFDYLVRPAGMPLRILLQRLGDDDRGVRMHVDLACDAVDVERRRHESLGATTVRIAEHWTTLRDPAGLRYCITDRDPSRS